MNVYAQGMPNELLRLQKMHNGEKATPTFSAAEMTRRVERIAGQVMGTSSGAVAEALTWSGTFHGIGARLLRLHASRQPQQQRKQHPGADPTTHTACPCGADAACAASVISRRASSPMR